MKTKQALRSIKLARNIVSRSLKQIKAEDLGEYYLHSAGEGNGLITGPLSKIQLEALKKYLDQRDDEYSLIDASFMKTHNLRADLDFDDWKGDISGNLFVWDNEGETIVELIDISSPEELSKKISQEDPALIEIVGNTPDWGVVVGGPDDRLSYRNEPGIQHRKMTYREWMDESLDWARQNS